MSNKKAKVTDPENIDSAKEDALQTISWKIINTYFHDNPNHLVAHHLESYNDFIQNGIPKIFRENNPFRIVGKETKKQTGKKTGKRKQTVNECLMFMGGKDGTKIHYGKPVIYDDRVAHYMFPNDARLRNMTYGTTIHYDVDIEFHYSVFNGDIEERKMATNTFNQIFLGRLPIMLQSNLCILHSLDRAVRFQMGECKNDYGGYFIIDGKEKLIVSQEKFADNLIYCRKYNNPETDVYLVTADIRSVSEDTSKFTRTTSVRLVAPETKYTNLQLVVLVPNIKQPVPLFILMRALGIESDQDIIQTCLLIDVALDPDNMYIDLFIPSIHHAGLIFTQQTALAYLAELTKRKTTTEVMEILSDYFLPHIGELTFQEKAFFIGHMVNRVLRVYTKDEMPTDRDNFIFKRAETSGALLCDLFREYYLIQKKEILRKIGTELLVHGGDIMDTNELSEDALLSTFNLVIVSNRNAFFKERSLEIGMHKGFKGNWGSEAYTKRIGVVQDMNRLSWFTAMSHLRKMDLQMDASAKVVGPRLLNSSQWGIIDPVDTPDGGNIGLHKHLAICTYVTCRSPTAPVVQWLKTNTAMKGIENCSAVQLGALTKIMVNGKWVGVIDLPIDMVNFIKEQRRIGVFPVYASVAYHNRLNEISICTDAGRLTRPIYYMKKPLVPSYQMINNKTDKDVLWTWEQLITGFTEKKTSSTVDRFSSKHNRVYNSATDLYDATQMSSLQPAIVEYMDSSEAETALIATNADDLTSTSLSTKWITHMEIDPSLIFGIMGNSIIYPEHNPLPRNAFSCGQSKQAVSLYHSNYQMRMDKMGVILNYGQIPLVKSRYLEHINHEEMPYGVNALVAIMSYTGYNVEDAILINKGSIDRGMFRTSYFTTYESREESAAVNKGTDSHFANIEKNNVKIKKDVDYSLLDKYGIIREGTQVNDKTVLIGKLVYNPDNPDLWIDDSTVPKKGQLGTVDKAFFTMGEEGFNVAKVRISEERVPAMGDKMASRAGQKGTLGLIVPEENMPYTADGIRPDLIINPHALPSRMTIGQIIESMFGIVCTQYGGFGDCTAFQIRGSNESTYAPMLVKAGFHSSGNHIMYNGMTGAMLSSDIFMGPTYYMRLKHMVKDKINFRAGGPMTMLTRQPVQGRANDGGLRIGEMERDGVLAHGMSQFLDDSFMKRADEYCMAVCNVTGTIAIYNPSRNLFLSPFADGPIQFSTNMDGSLSLNSVSRFGRSFSVVRVPYSLKLLMHELGCMGIQMRIVTDKNIDQLLNLSQSSNAIQLLNVSNDDELMKRVREFKQSLGQGQGRGVAVGLKEDFWKPNSDMIQMNKYDEPTTLTTYDAAVSYAMSHIHTISTLCASTSASKPFVHAIPLNPLTINGPWSFDAESVERSMNLIFNVLHTNCYLVSVHSPTLVHIVKCEPDGIPDVYETQLAEYNRVSKRPVPMANVRIMNCIVKERSSVSTFNREFEQWVNERNSEAHGHGGLPVGVYIFNLTDALILRDDNRPPWEPYSAPLNGMMPTYLPICGYSGALHYCDVPIPNYDDMAFVMSGSVITTKYNVWESKINKAVFRGGSTGCGVNADTNMRIRLAEMAGSSDARLYLDAGLTTINRNQPRFDSKVGLQLLQTTATAVEKMDMVEQGKYKYIIHIDGNVAAYRLLYTMQLGSVILKVQGAYQLWFEHLLQDGVNCVFIKPDLSDLLDKIRWCTQNDTLCKNIANNGVMLSKTLLTANCVSDTIEQCMDTMRRVACNEPMNEPEKGKESVAFEAHTPDEPPPEHLLAGKIKMQIGNPQPMLPVVSDLTLTSDILQTEEKEENKKEKGDHADSNPEDTKKIIIA